MRLKSRISPATAAVIFHRSTGSTCKLDKDPGPCEAAIRKYFYNKNTGDCERFTYGGCQGNANRFDSLSECRKACAGNE